MCRPVRVPVTIFMQFRLLSSVCNPGFFVAAVLCGHSPNPWFSAFSEVRW